MSVPLKDIIVRARDLLGEQVPNYWNPTILIQLANDALQDMCSDAQNLETLIQFAWPSVPGSTGKMAEEAALPVDLDQIAWCGYFAGQFFQLEQLEQSSVIVANQVQGIPVGFYIRSDTRQTLTQGAGVNTGDVYITNFEPQPYIGQDYFTALGFWPIPQAAYNTTIAGTRFHRWVQNPLDRCGVPRRFIMGPVYYILWHSKLKQEAMDLAAKYEQLYMKVKEDMNHYYIFNKQLKSGPDWGGTMWPSLTRGSSSVIFIDQAPTALNA